MSTYTMNKWTDDEKKYVLKKFKEGLSPEAIHKTGKITRSKYAIELKIYNQIYDALQNGESHEDVATEYNRTKKDIKEIEQKIFEMKNKSDVNTPYTNDGGYVLNNKSNIVDLSEFHNINRTMDTVLQFYENITRLNKLKKDNIIDESFYNDLIKKLNIFSFDKNKIICSLNMSKSTESIESTESIKSIESKESKESEKNKPPKIDKKIHKKKDESDDDSIEIEIPVKQFKKRLI